MSLNQETSANVRCKLPTNGEAKCRFLIGDFASHDREELRTQDAHARLGFSDDQIAGWLAAAGLTLVATDTLDGGELTVKLWLGARPGSKKALAA